MAQLTKDLTQLEKNEIGTLEGKDITMNAETDMIINAASELLSSFWKQKRIHTYQTFLRT